MRLHEIPLITIGMPVYNCERTVAQAIASILNQTFENWELVVLDDGSQDETVSIVRGFSDPRIRLIEGGCNRGLPACLNQIVAQCRSKFFARMDGDDIAYPSRLEQQLAYLQQHPEVDLVGGWITIFRNDGTPLGIRRGKAAHEQICSGSGLAVSVAHPTWMGRIEWFREHPYSTGAVRMEDWELLTRTSGCSRFANLQQVVLGYREDSLSVPKILTARVNKCRVLLQRAKTGRLLLQAVGGIAGECLKFLMDAIAIGTGTNRILLGYRTPALSAEEASQWRAVFDCTSKMTLDMTRAHG